MAARFPVVWGNPPDDNERWYTETPDRWHCVACGKESPVRAAAQCGECAHAWRWSWMLSLQHLRAAWRAGKAMPRFGIPATPWYHRIQLRRPSNVWICPCCSHDL